MGVTDSDHIAIHSSIALLQERFRQLHREKRRREERELLRLFSDTPVNFSTTHSNRHYMDHMSKRRRLLHADSLHEEKKPGRVSLSLWPSSSVDCQTELWDAARAPGAKRKQTEDMFTFRDSSCVLASLETGVDTSLHL